MTDIAKTVMQLIIALMVLGCTVDAKVSEKDLNKTITCTDTRDGTSFAFNTSNVTNVRAGFGADHSFDVVDNDGVFHRMTSRMEVYLKCVRQ